MKYLLVKFLMNRRCIGKVYGKEKGRKDVDVYD